MFILLGNLDLLEAIGLSKDRLMVLQYITSNPGGFTEGELVKKLKLRPSTASKIFKEFRESGVIIQGPAGKDKLGRSITKHIPTYSLFAAQTPRPDLRIAEIIREDPTLFRFGTVLEADPGYSPAFLERVKAYFPELRLDQQQNLAKLLSDLFRPVLVGLERELKSVKEGGESMLARFGGDLKKLQAKPIGIMTAFLGVIRAGELNEVNELLEKSIKRFMMNPKLLKLAQSGLLESQKVYPTMIFSSQPIDELDSFKGTLNRLLSNLEIEYGILFHAERKEIWVIARNVRRLPEIVKETANRTWSLDEAIREVGERTLEIFFEKPLPQWLQLMISGKILRIHTYLQLIRPDEQVSRRALCNLAREVEADSRTVAFEFYPWDPAHITIVRKGALKSKIPKRIGGADIRVFLPEQILEEEKLIPLEIVLGSHKHAHDLWQLIHEKRSCIICENDLDAADQRAQELQQAVLKKRIDTGVLIDAQRRAVRVFTTDQEKATKLPPHPAIEVKILTRR